MFDFDRVIERRGTHSSKWDNMARLSGIAAPDAIPMWVADMDFAAPPGVTEALTAETGRAVHGYYADTGSWAAALAEWMAHRHGLRVDRDWISPTPGIVSGLGLILQALSAQRRRIQPIGELYDELLTRGRRDGLMITGSEQDGQRAEGPQLVGNEIGPRSRLVADDGHRLGRQTQRGRRNHILVEGSDRAKVSQMPVEFRPTGQHAGCDNRHHDVAAITGIARHSEFPNAGRLTG